MKWYRPNLLEKNNGLFEKAEMGWIKEERFFLNLKGLSNPNLIITNCWADLSYIYIGPPFDPKKI